MLTMEHTILAQLTATVLLLLTPAVLRTGLPSTEPFSKFFSGLLRSFHPERRPRRTRRVAMRGARPWWE